MTANAANGTSTSDAASAIVEVAPSPEYTDGAWSWDPERVAPGEVVLMPSYRFATLNTVIESEGTRIFADCTDGSLLCKHGELGTSIGTWNYLEKVARAEGVPPPPRPSICDCTSTNFLHKKKAEPLEASRMPTSLFDHLGTMDTNRILVAGVEARQLPFATGDRATFLTSDGRTICRHGRLRASLIRMRAVEGKVQKCACTPTGLPRRSALKCIALGQCAAVPRKRPREEPHESPTRSDGEIGEVEDAVGREQ